MPNFDKTGPAGKGPKTGQGLGSCNGNQTEGGLRRGMGLRRRAGGDGRGLGQGLGRGRNR